MQTYIFSFHTLCVFMFVCTQACSDLSPNEFSRTLRANPTQEVSLLTGRKLPPLPSRPNYTAEGISHDHSKPVTQKRVQGTGLLPESE